MRDIPMYIFSGEDNVNKAVELLRQFPVGARLINVTSVFNSELQASCDQGALMPNSRMGELSSQDYDRERRSVEELGKLWGTADTLTPEELLTRVMDEGYFKELLACKQYLTTHVPNIPTIEGEVPMSSDTYDLCRWLDKFFEDETSVRNPLVGLADADRQGTELVLGMGSRADVLHDLEFLSCDLWHMATIADVPTLRSRIVLHPQDDTVVELLYDYCALLGLPQRHKQLESFSEYMMYLKDNQLSPEDLI